MHTIKNKVLEMWSKHTLTKFIANLVDLKKFCLIMELNLKINYVCAQLGVEHKIYSPPYRPQSNGRIESFHYFLKACISKHITPQVEWDDVVPLTFATYNFLPNEHSKESPFFLMFGRDAILPLNKLIQSQVRYLGNDENILSMQALKNIYEVVAQNLKLA